MVKGEGTEGRKGKGMEGEGKKKGGREKEGTPGVSSHLNVRNPKNTLMCHRIPERLFVRVTVFET